MSDFIKVELTEEQYDKISKIGITKLEVASIGCKMTIGGGCSDFEMTLMDKNRFNQPNNGDEALDVIDTTSKQVESLANDSELPNGSEWESGLPPVGVECCFTPDNNLWGFASTGAYLGEVLRYEGEQFVFLLAHDKYNMRPCHLIVSRTDKGEFSKPESPEQKAERERLEAAYDLYLTRLSISNDYTPYKYSEFLNEASTKLGFLAIVDKTGFRKEQ